MTSDAANDPVGGWAAPEEPPQGALTLTEPVAIEGFTNERLKVAQPAELGIYPEMEEKSKRIQRREEEDVFEFAAARGRDVLHPECMHSPWPSICLIIASIGGGDFFGSGFLIGRRTILTAGHCLFRPRLGEARQVIAIFGPTLLPNGQLATRFRPVRISGWQMTSQWASSNSADHDYGAIFLSDDTIFNAIGGWVWPMLVVTPGGWEDPRLGTINAAGYPFSMGARGTLHNNPGTVSGIESELALYDMPTREGQSGGPVYHVSGAPPQRRVAIGLHTNGFLGGGRGVRFTLQNMPTISFWQRNAASIPTS